MNHIARFVAFFAGLMFTCFTVFGGKLVYQTHDRFFPILGLLIFVIVGLLLIRWLYIVAIADQNVLLSAMSYNHMVSIGNISLVWYIGGVLLSFTVMLLLRENMDMAIRKGLFLLALSYIGHECHIRWYIKRTWRHIRRIADTGNHTRY